MTTTLRRKLELTTIAPEYGKNYNKGYLGFTYHNDNVIAKGIVYFTKWTRMSDIYASHVLIVTGENECIEADANQNCVRYGTLDHYFEEPHCQIFFRKPKDLTDEISDRIVQVAKNEVGKKYDYKSILTQLLSGTLAGHIVDRLVRGEFEDWLADRLNDSTRWICSELAAYTLDEQPEYRDRGILKHPNATISPQELFEDQVIFELWRNQLTGKSAS
jgi:hypothetical protein